MVNIEGREALAGGECLADTVVRSLEKMHKKSSIKNLKRTFSLNHKDETSFKCNNGLNSHSKQKVFCKI